MQILHNGKAIADLVDIQPPAISNLTPDFPSNGKIDLGAPISFPFEAQLDNDAERFFNYLATIPEEWDLFIHQCLEKYPI